MSHCPSADLNIYNPNGPTNAIHSPVCVSPDGGAAKLMGTIIPLLLITTAVLAFLMLLWGGVQYITSGGNQENVQKAKGKIMYAIIGLVVSFLSLVAFRIIGNLVGFNLFNLII